MRRQTRALGSVDDENCGQRILLYGPGYFEVLGVARRNASMWNFIRMKHVSTLICFFLLCLLFSCCSCFGVTFILIYVVLLGFSLVCLDGPFHNTCLNSLVSRKPLERLSSASSAKSPVASHMVVQTCCLSHRAIARCRSVQKHSGVFFYPPPAHPLFSNCVLFLLLLSSISICDRI